MNEAREHNVRTVLRAFAEIFPEAQKALVMRAPGRINLIGEYTDFNEGFVLPASVDREVLMAFAPRADKKCVLHSLNFDNVVEFDTDKIQPDKNDPWGNYPKGVVNEFKRAGAKLIGFNAVILGDVPAGGGMSSSAAVEAVTALCVKMLARSVLPASRLARLCQKAENDFAGVRCGIMDQFAVLCGKEKKAMLLDCRTLDVAQVTVPDELRFLVLNTKIKRDLASSEYNVRRFQCEESVKVLKRYFPFIKAIRDVSIHDFERVKEKLDPVHVKRVRHVVCENERAKNAATLLGKKDMDGFGALLYESHESLKNDFEVSTPELDFMVEEARGTEGIYGARLMGAGFGGCVLVAAQEEKAKEAAQKIAARYEERFHIKPDVHACAIVDGAGLVKCETQWQEILLEKAENK